ncbi:hypothetical protein COOONC_07846 [Cooperia oncophora]
MRSVSLHTKRFILYCYFLILLSGMMGGGGGVVPPVLLDEARVPRFYRDAIAACGATQQHMLPHTALVYNLMVTSGLPRPVLSYIWSAVNRTLPGQLTRPEFFSCLALIALAQKGESLAALSTMSSLPIPFLQSVQVPLAQPLAAPMVNVAKPAAAQPKEQRQSSSFIPTSLLMGRRNNVKKKEVDLIGEALPPPDKSPSKEEGGLPSPILPPPIPGWSSFALRSLLGPSAKLVFLGPSKSGHHGQTAVANLGTNGFIAKANSTMNDLCSIDWSSLAQRQAATASRDLGSPTTGSSKSDEDGESFVLLLCLFASLTGFILGYIFGLPSVSTASNFSMACSTASEINGSMACSTASEINGSAKVSHAMSAELLECWEKVIAAATEIFKTADRLLCSANDDSCLNHLYFVVCRVERSAKSELPKGCREEIDYCTRIWKRLANFLEDPEEEDRTDTAEKPCAICCQPVSRAVYFGGQTYHSECANLWVNDVNSLLPNMHLVS